MSRIKGHAMSTERTGLQSLLHVPRCKCGWHGAPQRTADGARVAYRTHLEVMAIRSAKAGVKA